MSDNSESFEEWLDEHFLDSPCLTQYGKDWICAKAVREKLQTAEKEIKQLKGLIDWIWENEPEKEEVLDKIQVYLQTMEKIERGEE